MATLRMDQSIVLKQEVMAAEPTPVGASSQNGLAWSLEHIGGYLTGLETYDINQLETQAMKLLIDDVAYLANVLGDAGKRFNRVKCRLDAALLTSLAAQKRQIDADLATLTLTRPTADTITRPIHPWILAYAGWPKDAALPDESRIAAVLAGCSIRFGKGTPLRVVIRRPGSPEHMTTCHDLAVGLFTSPNIVGWLHKFMWNHHNTFTQSRRDHQAIEDVVISVVAYVIHRAFPNKDTITAATFTGVTVRRWTFTLVKKYWNCRGPRPDDVLQTIVLDLFTRICLHLFGGAT